MDVFADEDANKVDELLRKARQEEKDKLYPEIKGLKEKLEQSTTENNKLKGEFEEKIKDLENKLTNINKENEDLKKKSKKDKDQQIISLEETIEELKNKLTDVEESNSAQVQKMQLEILKKELILEAGDEIVPGLVTGNSEEEIKASIETAKQEYKKIKEKTLNGVDIMPPNPDMRKVTIKGKTPEDIAKMTREEYMEFRKQNGGIQRPTMFK